MPANFTYIELPVNHDTQSALAAGVNIAIGDYLVEIEDISIDMDYNLIMDMYRKCQEGNDFVFLTPQNTSFLSKLFYKVLNSSLTNFFKADIGSSLMTLSSRRGQNKTADIGRKLVNRNVSYVLSGLKYAYISCDINYRYCDKSLSEYISVFSCSFSIFYILQYICPFCGTSCRRLGIYGNYNKYRFCRSISYNGYDYKIP